MNRRGFFGMIAGAVLARKEPTPTAAWGPTPLTVQVTVPALLTAGERVLTKADQQRLAEAFKHALRTESKLNDAVAAIARREH